MAKYHWEPCDCAFNHFEVCQHVEYSGIGSAELHAIDSDSVEICDLYIWPELRGKGHGKAFLTYLLKELRRRGVEKVILHVDPTNIPALRIYSKAGFQLRCTELHMELRLKGTENED